MKQDDIRNEYTKTYDKGLINHGVRVWFYLKAGLNLINEFKYLAAGIFALYYTLQLEDYRLMVLLFCIAIPLLILLGWFYTFRMAKALEWTNMVFSSYFARYNVDLNENTADNTGKTVKLLEELLQEIKNKGKIQQ